MTHPHLLRPGHIGSMLLRNRIVMSPMETMYGTPEGLPSERTVAYFARRARGGVGLITVGATGIDHQHPETPGGLQIGSDDTIAAHRELVAAVHEHGAKIQPQIVHAGPDGLGPEMFGVTSWGPSVIPSYLTGRPSEEVSKEQLAVILDQFKAAVVRAREAGYDGIELHAAHGYMFLGSFLAPQRNRRGDRYRGSSMEGRIRVVLETLQAIRGEVGDDFPITLRISGYERVAGGRPMYETARVAPLLVEAGVDAFHVSGGVIDRLVTQMVNGADYGDALNVGAAAAVKEAVDVPVIAVGRLHDVDVAEAVLADGRADFIAMGRPLLADPDIPTKLSSGQADRIRRCISCENCIDSLEMRFSTDCAVNPETGREHTLSLEAPTVRKKVLVVGGGPGGMETARIAATLGHRVTLVERAGQLGGALLWASVVHPDNEPFLHWLRSEVGRAGVEVRLREEIFAEDVATFGADAVVVATGARVEVPDLPGADLPHVMTGPAIRELLAGLSQGDSSARWQRLAGRVVRGRAQRLITPGLVRRVSHAWLPFGDRVCVVGGDLAAIELAEFLAERGRLVAVLEPGPDIAPEVGLKRRTEHMDHLDRLGVTVHVDVDVHRIERSGVVFTPAGGTERTIPADTVVIAGSPVADTSLLDAVTALLPDTPVLAVGDTTGLGLIQKATSDALTVAHAL